MRLPLIILIFVASFLQPIRAISADSTYHKSSSILLSPYSRLNSYALEKNNIQQVMRDAAEFQLNEYGPSPGLGWTVGTFYSSFVSAYKSTQDPWYFKQALKWGKTTDWDIKHSINADEICPGQTYLDLYFINQDKTLIDTLKQKISKAYFNKQVLKAGDLHKWDTEDKPFTGRNVWSWADALYMAPPVFARLGKATGDNRYFSTLHKLYWDAVDNLYDPDEQLFFRDSKADTEHLTSPNNKKIFWSRGNGWVFAGLARTIGYLPNNDPQKQKYLTLFEQMAYSLAKYQQPDGLWRSSLNDPNWYPTKESTGSAFFIFGIAKGVNQGWLEKEYFLPILIKGWSGLVGIVSPSGKVGYSQVVAGSPHEVRPHDSIDYAQGAFILAASEMHSLVNQTELPIAETNQFVPRLVAKNAHWSNNNQSLLAHKGVYYPSYRKSDGRQALTAFTAKVWPNVSAYARKEKILAMPSSPFTRDIPALVATTDENLIGLYANEHMALRNITLPLWSEMQLSSEQKALSQLSTPKMFKLSTENNRIYLFAHSSDNKFVMFFSDDQGKNWQQQVTPFTNNGHQPTNSYIISNGLDRIDILYTTEQAKHTTNLHHIYFQHRQLYNSYSQPINSAKSATLVATGKFAANADVSLKPKLTATYIKRKTNGQYALYLAILSNNNWTETQIGFVGTEAQADTASVAIHPINANSLVISTQVHPHEQYTLANNKNQLFKAQVNQTETQWQQLTFDPVFNQLNPKFSTGSMFSLFWLSGDITNNTYQTDILMSEQY
ncbi:hypothetical protein DS2_03280 [Catenovulum agarivorans DS-2]|uniref:Uncharacterized protein n=1 Tax=Catenovulum agarivorans DS-2 TaxID=1328313 RepID=W7QUG2_9ALTE|nr:glycoside hydrolase family 88 protein [Catenovulum agarivorans]EWH11498.1 hypothetical protein DS2_03280 [Catenovulum agarivorans DS-2]